MKKQKKESFSLMTIKIFLAILLFTGMGVIVIGGVYIIGGYYNSEINNLTTKPVDQETESYYDLLEKECDNDRCCLASLRVTEGIYKEIKEDGNCPNGFEISSFSCPKSLDWCEPIENLNIIGNYVNGTISMCAQNCNRYYIGSYEILDRLQDVDGDNEKEIVFATGDMIEVEELPTIAGPDSVEEEYPDKTETVKFKIDNYQKIDFPKVSISEKELINYLENKNVELTLKFENPLNEELKFKVRINNFQKYNNFQNVILKPNETKIVQYTFKGDDDPKYRRKGYDSLDLVIINDFVSEENYRKYYWDEANDLDSSGTMIYIDKFIRLEDCVEPDASNWKIYQNEEFGFEITLTDVWDGYKTITESDATHTYIKFQIPTKDAIYGNRDGYATPFTISVYSVSKWQEIQQEEGRKPKYIAQNDINVFACSTWQDAPSDLLGKSIGFDQIFSTFKFIER
ncbi:MAG: hypothetical protein KAI71_01060 [Candidatus Pacebacteria bacterium]|nr:hypothetical protein [Candidatus Paceibacterota bacterium]